jgi:hypothetical protein
MEASDTDENFPLASRPMIVEDDEGTSDGTTLSKLGPAEYVARIGVDIGISSPCSDKLEELVLNFPPERAVNILGS